MLSNEVIARLETIAQEVAGREGCELYDIEFGGHGGRRTLRVLIDKPGTGAGIEDCSNVSRGLSLLLDVEDPISGAYDLEVSTPGVDRILRKPWHFERVVGQKVQVRLRHALESFGIQSKSLASAKQVAAVLTAADAQGFSLQLNDEQVTIPFDSVEKAKVLFEFTAKGEKKGDKKKKK